MGVSGAGKTTIGAALARRLGWTFQEGDDLHPRANIAKMSSGTPLDDADRAPWLAKLRAWIAERIAEGRDAVVTCSALKQAYRSALVGHRDAVVLVYLDGPRDLVERRLKARRGHFMPPALLASQFDALQPPMPLERPIVVDITQSIDAQVDAVVAALNARRS